MDYSEGILIENAVKVRLLLYQEGKSSAYLYCENASRSFVLNSSLIVYLDIDTNFECESIRLLPMDKVPPEIKKTLPNFIEGKFLVLFEGGHRTFLISAHKIVDIDNYDLEQFETMFAEMWDEEKSRYRHIFPE